MQIDAFLISVYSALNVASICHGRLLYLSDRSRFLQNGAHFDRETNYQLELDRRDELLARLCFLLALVRAIERPAEIVVNESRPALHLRFVLLVETLKYAQTLTAGQLRNLQYGCAAGFVQLVRRRSHGTHVTMRTPSECTASCIPGNGRNVSTHQRRLCARYIACNLRPLCARRMRVCPPRF
jgi:hypothetical protein